MLQDQAGLLLPPSTQYMKRNEAEEQELLPRMLQMSRPVSMMLHAEQLQ